MQKARLKISSAEIDRLNEICSSIIDIAKKSKVKICTQYHCLPRSLN